MVLWCHYYCVVWHCDVNMIIISILLISCLYLISTTYWNLIYTWVMCTWCKLFLKEIIRKLGCFILLQIKHTKLVNARYCDRFPIVKWRDGRVVHVQVTPELHREYERRMTVAINSFHQRYIISYILITESILYHLLSTVVYIWCYDDYHAYIYMSFVELIGWTRGAEPCLVLSLKIRFTSL